jgi:hypothetical protein
LGDDWTFGEDRRWFVKDAPLIIAQCIFQFAASTLYARLRKKRLQVNDNVDQSPVAPLLKDCLASDQAQPTLNQFHWPANDDLLRVYGPPNVGHYLGSGIE